MVEYKSSFMSVNEHNKILKIEEARVKKEEKTAKKIAEENKKKEKMLLKQQQKELKVKIKPIVFEKKEKKEKVEKKEEIIDDYQTITQKLSLMINDDNIVENYKPVFSILKNDTNSISKIIHIADIHIRLSKLHDEYNFVFNNLYEQLNCIKLTNPDTIICLCGDLLHSKDELKPDTIIHTWNFIKNLSDIFPLIIITGNHDTIELNNNKVDSITSILKDRPINNTYYLLNSGVYIYNNIIFGVSSIIDKFIMNLDTVHETLKNNNFIVQDNKFIGLYHGSVDGAVNDLGFRIRGNKKLKDFASLTGETYDYILLGDIHKFQYLDKNKTVAYSSSLISQNFGETDKFHGFLEWNILDGTSEYHIVRNEYAYHKINIEELILDNPNTGFIILSNDLINKHLMPINSGFLKIEFDESLIKKINRENLKNQITEMFPKLVVSWQLIFNKNSVKNVSSNISNKLPINTIYNDSMNELIRKFIKLRFYGTTEELVDKVLMYLNKIIVDTQSNDNGIEYVKSDWKLIWLSFDYMYGYGPNNVIDFTKYPSNEIIGIFGNNAIGKSSLIDIITYMLYSRSARDESSTNPRDIVNVAFNKAFGILILESNNIKYLIKRTVTRSYSNATKKYNIRGILRTYKMVEIDSNTNVSTNSTFKLHDKIYNLVSLTEENRMQTDDILVPIIGTYDNFVTTSVLLQGNYKTFKSKTNAEKKEFLCQILKLDYFKKCDTVIVDRFKLLKSQYSTLNKILNGYSNKSIEQLQLEVNNIDLISLPKYNTQLNKIQDDINEIHDTIHNLSLQLINISVDKNINADQLNKEIESLEKQLNDSICKFKENVKQIELLQNKINNLDKIKFQDSIVDSYSKFMYDVKNKQTFLMDKINIIFNEKQNYPLIKICKSITNDTIVSNINSNKDSIHILETVKNSTIKNKNSIIVLIQQLVDTDTFDNYDILIKNKIELQDGIDKVLEEITLYSNDLNIMSNKISKLDLLNESDSIKTQYLNHMNLIKHESTNINNKIDDLINNKMNLSIKQVNNDNTIDQLLELRNKYLLGINDYLLDDVLDINIKLKHERKMFNDLLEKLIQKKYLIGTIDSLDSLIEEKNSIEKYLIDNISIFTEYTNLISNHDTLFNSKSSIIFNSIDTLEKDIINNKYNDCLKLVLLIKDSLKYTINNSDYMNKYNNGIDFIKSYNEEKIKLDNIIKDINSHTTIDKIDKQINDIKIFLEEIEYSEKIYENILKGVKICKDIKHNINDELDKINEDIDILKYNSSILKEKDEIDSKINEYKSKLISLNNDTIIKKYEKLIEQQDIFIKYDADKKIILDKLNEIKKKEEILVNNLKLVKDDIDIYNQSKEIIINNNKIQNKINKIYDTINSDTNEIPFLCSKKVNIPYIEDVEDINILIELIEDNINKCNSRINEELNNEKILIENNKTLLKLNELDNQITIIKSELDMLNNPDNLVIKEYHNLQDQLLNYGKYNNEIMSLNKINNEHELQNSKININMVELKNILSNYEKSFTQITHNETINKKIDECKENIKVLINSTKEINSHIINLNNSRSTLIKTINDINKTTEELNEIKTEIDIYDVLSKLTCRDGVQLYLLSESLDKITNKVNNILEPFINKTIKLELNNDTIELSIISKNDTIIHTISGMESFMLDLVFKIIIGHISVIPKSNVIFMDESISVLDKHRMASIDELFSFLKQYYETVYLITHMKQVNNHINNSIEINKNNDYSLIYNLSLPKNTINFSDISIVEANIDTNIIDIDISSEKKVKVRRNKKIITNEIEI
jgi:DNA repair exonuclease SbcCD ATPase subunit